MLTLRHQFSGPDFRSPLASRSRCCLEKHGDHEARGICIRVVEKSGESEADEKMLILMCTFDCPHGL